MEEEKRKFIRWVKKIRPLSPLRRKRQPILVPVRRTVQPQRRD